ncbi:FAD binding domain-containing protein [Colletotrichum higginsianum]|nr:FAD binding domain-containing protein [Colletotrichum higginsianum]
MTQVRKAMHHFAAVAEANVNRSSLIISATLEAPQILVDTVNRDIVTWRTIFDEGSLVITTEDADRGRPRSTNGP